ncbi:Hormone-sensitive lipase [Trichinella pseudospiralis]|uniref:Hormone-sensitive lipase n=1 Tax=Trichinella pseudospiralis TaxID=6337 RepID=A0A0V1KGB0_TRIPS|nr:Hormone-sensitive lipase [Trichinella pseudospiralis]
MAREYPCKKIVKPMPSTLMLMWNKIPTVQTDFVTLETMAVIANAIFVSRRFKSIRVMNIWYRALNFRPALPIYYMNAMLKTSCLNSNKYPVNKGERESLGKLVYSSGSMGNLIRGVKLFSLLTTTIAVGMQPMIWRDMFVHDDRSALLTTLTLSFLSFSVMCSPLLLNLLTKRYVICMYHDEKLHLFSVMTYNIFAWPRIIQFKFEDIKAFDSPILANLLVNSYPLLMISTNFTDEYVLEKFLPLLGEEETPKRKTMKANVGLWNSKKFSVSRDSVCSLIEKLFYEFPVHLRSYSIEGVSFEKHICVAINSLQEVKSSLHSICMAMCRFDYDISIVGNGYRSIVTVFDLCLIGLLRSLFKISKISHRRWFRASRPVKEVVAYAEILRVLCQAVDLVSKYLPKANSQCLFLTNVDADDLDRLMSSFEQLDQSNFYGRQIGFQFCSSVSNVFHVIGTALASYSTLWNHSNVWYRRYPSIVYSCCRFLVNPENRSKHIAKIFRHSDLELCRSFWSLLESPILRRSWTKARSERIVLHSTYRCAEFAEKEWHNGEHSSTQRLFWTKTSLRSNFVTSPLAWPGEIFYTYEVAFMGEKVKDRTSRSNFLVLHCHGGGFIATSTKTHETYLKFWAAELNCPIVSVDYSLAPENPYPRALEEALYAYAWCLTHADFLGWTGQYLCFAGESAGGLLLTSTCLKLIQLDVARLPDKLVAIYTPFLVEFAPSASRLLSLLDPLIPWGIMYRCLYAYKFGALTDDQRFAEVREGRRKVSKSGIEMKTSAEECLGEEKILPDREIETEMSDSKYIRLSVELFDREFIKFLSMHELTEPSFYCLPESRLGKSAEEIQRDQMEEPNLSKSRCGSVTDNLVEVCSTVSDIFVENVSRILKDSATNVSSAVDGSSENGNDPVLNRKRLQTSTNDSGSGIFADGDPLLSPWLATDELLRSLPPTSVVACHLDPLLDDSISFCKKLRQANVPHTLDLIESLPHGFMNLMSFSKECRLATQLCLRRIKETLINE